MFFQQKKFYLFFILFFWLFGFLSLPVKVKAAIVASFPFVKLKLVGITASLVNPTFSWKTDSYNPLASQILYLDTDKNKIFTDQAIFHKNMDSDVFAYTLLDAESLSNSAEIYFWGIKAEDSQGQIGYSEIGVFSLLILQYEPILYFHQAEDFYPLSIEGFVTYSSLWDSKKSEPDEKIKYEYTVQVDDLSPPGIDTTDWYLQFSEDLIDKTPDPLQAKQEYQDLQSWNEAPFTYYAFQTDDSFVDDEGQTNSFIVLEYWYFYAFNDFGAKVVGGNNHEGDWETVMIFLDKTSQEPQYVAYSQHHNAGRTGDSLGEPPYIAALQFDSIRRAWSSKEVVKQGDKIISFIGLGSHANYPNNNNGRHLIPLYPDDLTSYDGKHFFMSDWQQKYLFEKTNFPDWLINYKGYWGVVYPTFNTKIQSGSKSPYYSEYDKFSYPVQWAALDKIGKKTIREVGIQTLDFTTSQAKIVFNKTLEIGTEIVADLHNEIISFGQNIKDLQLGPRFWDFSFNLIPNTFQADITLKFNPQELRDFGFSDLAKLTVYTFNESINKWTVVSTIVDLINSAVKFNATHFSYYALGLLPEQEPPVDEFIDITDKVKVVIESKKGKYNKTTGQKEISVIIINKTTENISGDLRLAITNIDKVGVALLNPDGLTEQSLPYVEFSQNYEQCAFTGTEQDLPADIKNSLKKRLLKKFIRFKKRCDKILSLYPELAPFFDLDILPPKETTLAKILRFAVPTKKERYFEVDWQVWNKG